MIRRNLLVLVAATLLASPLVADNWPHWRGPDRIGSTSDEVAVQWSATQNVLWRTSLPELSGSTPIIWGNRVFLSVAQGEELFLWALDRSDGSILWQHLLDSRNETKRKGNMSSPSPVTDGEGVWVMTGTGILKGLDFDGGEMWSIDLQREFGPFGILHGYSSSPLLHGDSLYVQVLHGFHTDDPSYLMRIDKATGRVRWRIERPTDAPREAPDAYTTPGLLEVADRVEIVISGADYVTGHDPETGKELWRVPGLNPSANPMQRVVASPLVAGSMIFAPSRVNPLLALNAEGGAGAMPEVSWSTSRGPDVPTPALADGQLFILTDRGIVWNLNATTGEVIWGPERVHSSTYSASPVVAGGRLYVTNEAGLTTVLDAGPAFKVLAENDLDEYTLSSLAIADGQIFLRTADHLYCIASAD